YAAADVIEFRDGSFIGGISSFVVDGKLTSGIGDVDLEYGLKFKMNENDHLYTYRGSDDERAGMITVNNLNIGVIAGNDILDKVSGSVWVTGKGFDSRTLDLDFHGNLTKVGVYDYDY